MLYKLILSASLLCPLLSSAQYSNDNVAFKTVDPADLCTALENNKGYLLLDVRSQGEFNDTSAFSSLNIGHLKGAKNIDIRELSKRVGEISAYKNKPVFVYCSHSQRSRVVSKILADSGFTKVHNVNGGMTAFYYTDARQKGCLQSMIQSNNKYTIISAAELCGKLGATGSTTFVLDVRSDSAYRHISTSNKDNAYAFIVNAVHIPLQDLATRIEEVPRDRDIVVTDLHGNDAAKAAQMLKEKGYTRVSVLIEGMYRWLQADSKDLSCKYTHISSPVAYKTVGVTEFGRMTQQEKDFVVIDVRNAEEFANRHKDAWRNNGHVKNAVNIPADSMDKHMALLQSYKDKKVFIYGFSSEDAGIYTVANKLTALGFKQVHVLMGGLFGIRWTAANVKGQGYLNGMMENVPKLN